MITISESAFAERLREVLPANDNIGAVTGPGRSGAVAAVYASHMLGVPFVPYGGRVPGHLGRLLIVDTARQSGRTLRKAASRYQDNDPLVVVAFEEPPRVAFWYEWERNVA
jgi:adenine/guanine phosphoribosyltransferase-like PRPP-binding protein